MNMAVGFLKNKSTTQIIVSGLEKVCSILPGSFEETVIYIFIKYFSINEKFN